MTDHELARAVEFEYAIADKVRIKALCCDAHITALTLDEQGRMYRIVYWDEGKRESTWVYGWEIEKL